MKRITGLVIIAMTAVSVPASAIAVGTVLKRVEKSWNELERWEVDLLQSVELLSEQKTRYYGGILYLLRREKRVFLECGIIRAVAENGATC